MTKYKLGKIAEYTGGNLVGNAELTITDISFDTRKLVAPKNSIFFALKTSRNDGHKYINTAFDKGVRAFVVADDYHSEIPASFIKVGDTLLALQQLAAKHRSNFSNPVLAITGSNGKTTVKEWLTQVLQQEINIASSPRSFNSQIGVPLSLWQIEPQHHLAIIEAGISEVGEMKRLAEMIAPSIGIFTNVGDAHLQNFDDKLHLIREKAVLFSQCEWVVVNGDQKELVNELKKLHLPIVSWGLEDENDIVVRFVSEQNGTKAHVKFSGDTFEFLIPFTEHSSLENACQVIVTSLKLKIKGDIIQKGISALEPLDMRLQVLKGINNCMLINDAYTADIKALESSLDLAHTYAHNRSKTLIISDFPFGASNTYQRIQKLIEEKNIKRLITIGIEENIAREIHSTAEVFHSKSSFLTQDLNQQFQNEVVVIKGARKYELESIAKRLQLKDHQTVLEINLNAFTENLNYYKKLLHTKTKVMAMVKAFSYGSGSYEVASHLESLGVDYLAVAYADEGIALRKNGIQLPILVLNPEPTAFKSIIRYNLEPEIYSIELLKLFIAELSAHELSEFPVHIKLDSGMHRLGIEADEIDLLISHLSENQAVHVESIFSHLAASEDSKYDAFTKSQTALFQTNSEKIIQALDYSPLRHICNTAAISRFPNAHFDMVRLGIGLYGISADEKNQNALELAGKLKTTIIQTRIIQQGESLGYGRNFYAENETKIAIIPIGYADGLSRALGNGDFQVKIGNETAPIIGTICMDMAFVDISHCPAKTGDEVVIFDSSETIKKIANTLNTIPYEVLSSISHRVKRIYFAE